MIVKNNLSNEKQQEVKGIENCLDGIQNCSKKQKGESLLPSSICLININHQNHRNVYFQEGHPYHPAFSIQLHSS